MTYRELPMIDVKEVLRRWLAGHSNRKIARETGIDRDTAARYVAVAKELALPNDRDLTEGELHEIAQRVQARPLPDRSAEWIEIAKHREKIVEWLGRNRPLRLTKIPYAAQARRHRFELRHAAPLRDARARMAQADTDGASRRPAGGTGSAGRLRSDGSFARHRDGPAAHALGTRDHADAQPLPVRLADVLAVDRGGVRRVRSGMVVLRRDAEDDCAGQHARHDQGSRRAQPRAGRGVPRLRAGARNLRRPCTHPISKRQGSRRESSSLRPRKPPGGRSTDTADYPVGKAAYALRSVDALVAKVQREKCPRGHVRRANRGRAVAVDADASGLRASSALRQVRRGTRRGRLPERARVRRRRRRTHHADAQVGHQT